MSWTMLDALSEASNPVPGATLSKNFLDIKFVYLLIRWVRGRPKLCCHCSCRIVRQSKAIQQSRINKIVVFEGLLVI